ncbi:uncharacterized protein GIQ15_06313 [Arthroderma uncinatum]|uniref:uncharacterized protein n=1 Tax=Arthroderma uncinatum TaxID=74035 RepID=UPI00144A9215|nr:uncharacterized protein GIQ15_06313 [Arthroderma uncinatum]KAF3480966.1 hypothetical protein GIQ15_06313 [Arthroderma uncinatum]
MPALPTSLMPSRLHHHHKRQLEGDKRTVLVACVCSLILLSIALYFYRARKRYEKAAPARLHPNIQLQRQDMPQQPGMPQQFNTDYTHYPVMPPAQVGLRSNDAQFYPPAPPYTPREQDQTKPQDDTFPRTRTPPPTYIPSTQPAQHASN